MPHLSATEASHRFSDLLDAAERGEEVVVEREGVRFRLVSEPRIAVSESRPSPLIVEDPELLSGEWTWHPDLLEHLGARLGRRAVT